MTESHLVTSWRDARAARPQCQIRSRRAPRASRLVRLAGLVFCLSCGWLSAGTILGDDESPGAYRRIFVPADSPELWPDDGVRRLPVARDEVERMAHQAAERQSAQRADEAHLAVARYAARLAGSEGTWRLAGQAEVEPSWNGPGDRIVSLSPMTMAVTQAEWLERDEPVQLGAWRTSSSGMATYGVRAAESGRLRLHWVLAPEASMGQETTFALRLPSAVRQEFLLTTPRDVEVRVEPGWEVKLEGATNATETAWRLHLPGVTTHRVRVIAPRPVATSLGSQRTRVAETYDVTPQGLEYQARFPIEASNERRRQLRIALRGELAIADVAVDGQSVPFRTLPEAPGILVVDLASSSTINEATVHGLAALRLGRRWTLPAARLLDAMWKEGSATLRVDARLALQSLIPADASLVGVTNVGEKSEAGETYRLQAWSESATAEVVVAERTARLTGDADVVVEMEPQSEEVIAHAVWELKAEGSSAFHFSADASEPWVIESVETSPPQALGDWHVALAGSERGRLHVDLRRSPTADAPVRIRASGRAPRQRLGASIGVKHLHWIRARDVRLERQWLHVRSDQGRIEASRSLAAWTVRDKESARPPETGFLEANRADGGLSAVVIDLTAADPEALLRLSTKAATFAASSWTTLRGRSGECAQTSEIQIEPVGGAVAEFIVGFRRPLPRGASWDCNIPAATVHATLESSLAEGPVESRWTHYRVALSIPMATPFRVTCGYRERGDAFAANVPALVAAEKSRCWAILHGDRLEYEASATGEKGVAPPPDVDRDSPPLLGAFRVDPYAESAPTLRRHPRSDRAQATHSPTPGGEPRMTPGAFAWRVSAQTIGLPNGSDQLTLRYFLEVDSATHVHVQVGDRYALESARINGTIALAEGSGSAVGDGAYRFSLPPGERFIALTLVLRGARSRWGIAPRIDLQLPQTSFPVATGDWTVWFPPSFAAQGPAPGSHFAEETFAHGLASWAPNDPLTGPSGWRSWRQTFAFAPKPVQLRSLSAASAVRWGAAWGAFAVALIVGKKRSRYTDAALIACIVAALAGLDVLWDAPTGALCGIAAAVVARRAAPRLADRCVEATPILKLLGRTATRAEAIALAICVTSAGASPTTLRAHEPPAIYYPMDAVGAPSGDDLYVPEILWKEWETLHSANALSDARYVVTGVNYEFDLRRPSRTTTNDANLQEMNVRLQSFVPQAELVLPLHKDDADWAASPARLDGRPVELQWADDGQSCIILAPLSGFHELRLGFVPKTSQRGEAARFAFHTLPFPGATATLRYDEGIRNPRIGDAVEVEQVPLSDGAVADRVGLAERSLTPDRLRLTLPPLALLETEWTPAPRVEGVRVEVQQETELRIEPTASTLNVRLEFFGESLPSRRLVVSLPSDLKLLPLPEGSPVVKAETLSGREPSLELHLSPTVRLPAVVQLGFQVQRGASTGRFQFPDVRTRGMQTVRRRFAVAIAEGLAYRVGESVGLQDISPDEFADDVGGTTPQLQLTYAVLQETPRWSLFVRPQTTVPHFKETIRVACQRSHAQIEWIADVVAPGSRRLMLAPGLAPGIRLEGVEVRNAQGTLTPCRASQRLDAPTQLALFLEHPLATGDQIRIFGALDYDISGAMTTPLPAFSVENRGAVELEIYRHVDVATQWQTPTLAPPIASGPPLVATADLAVVGRYRLSRERYAAELRITRNRPQLLAELATSLTQRDGKAVVRLSVAGRVQEGIVDRLHVNAPLGMRPPFVCQPDAKVGARPHPLDPGRQLLTVLLGETYAPTEAVTLQLSGDLETTGDNPINLPHLSLEDVQPGRQFVVLPQRWGERTIQWRHPGMQPTALPGRFASLASDARDGIVYEAIASDFGAEQVQSPKMQGQAGLPLQAGVVQLDADGSWEATVRIAVQPGDASTVQFTLPANLELLRAAVDGRSELVTPAGERTWRCLLGPPRMPRMMEICYRWSNSKRSKIAELSVPTLSVDDQQIPWTPMLWQVAEPLGRGQFQVLGGKPIDEVESLRRLRLSLENARSEADPAAALLPLWELEQWSNSWSFSRRMHRPAMGPFLWCEQTTADSLKIARIGDWSARSRFWGAALAGVAAFYILRRKW